MTSRQAIAFVREHGVVLEAAAGPVPTLTHAIAGTPVRGSWWSHPRSHQMFALTRAVRDCEDVLVCCLVGGKITYVHRRLWAALVRLANRFPRAHLAQVREVHTPSGRHMLEELAFPKWVALEVASQAARLSDEEATRLLGPWCASAGRSRPVRPRPRSRARRD